MSHAPEILILIALLIFGPNRLPEIGRSIGKALSGFQRGMRDDDGGDREVEL